MVVRSSASATSAAVPAPATWRCGSSPRARRRAPRPPCAPPRPEHPASSATASPCSRRRRAPGRRAARRARPRRSRAPARGRCPQHLETSAERHAAGRGDDRERCMLRGPARELKLDERIVEPPPLPLGDAGTDELEVEADREVRCIGVNHERRVTFGDLVERTAHQRHRLRTERVGLGVELQAGDAVADIHRLAAWLESIGAARILKSATRSTPGGRASGRWPRPMTSGPHDRRPREGTPSLREHPAPAEREGPRPRGDPGTSRRRANRSSRTDRATSRSRASSPRRSARPRRTRPARATPHTRGTARAPGARSARPHSGARPAPEARRAPHPRRLGRGLLRQAILPGS